MDVLTMAASKGKYKDHFYLPAYGIDASRIAATGGSVAVDASELFEEIKLGNDYLLSNPLGDQILTFPIGFYQWTLNGFNLECIGFRISGFYEGTFVHADYVLTRTELSCAVTQVGA